MPVTRAPHRVPEDADPARELVRLACLTYGHDDPERWERARALHAARPELVDASIHAAAVVGDADAVARHLAADPDLARRTGGPFDWEPLLSVAYSRTGTGDPLAVARLLLAHGADPDAGYLWEGYPPGFTALTGAFGEGEGSPRRQPRHPRSLELAELLLAAGADPNDEQTLYNRHFEPDDDHLVLLLAHGLGTREGGRWKAIRSTPAQMLEDQLVWASARDYADRVDLLLRHGVDPDGRGTRHPTMGDKRALELATASGSARIPGLLLAAGARPLDLDPVGALIAAGMRGDPIEAPPAVVAEAIRRHPGQVREAARHGRREAVRRFVALGFDPRHVDGRTALHEAAWRGDEPMVDLLLELGADPTARDVEHHGTPAGWARHNGHAGLAERLERIETRDPTEAP